MRPSCFLRCLLRFNRAREVGVVNMNSDEADDRLRTNERQRDGRDKANIGEVVISWTAGAPDLAEISATTRWSAAFKHRQGRLRIRFDHVPRSRILCFFFF